jgi:AraC-like DNA-binding protein
MYREILPPARLAKHVACLWVQTVDDGPLVQRVVPDACTDVISIVGDPPTVVGPTRGAALIELPARTVIVGARFRPGMARAVLGVPASEILDRDAPLDDLWGRDVARRLHDELGQESSIAAKLQAMERHVSARVAAAAAPDPLVAAGVQWLARHPDRHVGEFARSTGVSSRQLQRRFTAAVGYGPKRLHRVLRLQRLLVVAATGGRSMAALAADAGYLDQAHMIREVTDLAGAGPRSVLLPGPRPSMSEFFKGADGRDSGAA